MCLYETSRGVTERQCLIKRHKSMYLFAAFKLCVTLHVKIFVCFESWNMLFFFKTQLPRWSTGYGLILVDLMYSRSSWITYLHFAATITCSVFSSWFELITWLVAGCMHRQMESNMPKMYILYIHVKVHCQGFIWFFNLSTTVVHQWLFIFTRL